MLMFFRVLLIVATIVLIVVGCFDSNKEESKESKKGALWALVPIVIFVLTLCVVYVPSNNVGIRWSAFSGTSSKTLNEGITFKSPIDKVFLLSLIHI